MNPRFSEIKNLVARNAVKEAEKISLWIKLGGGALAIFLISQFLSGVSNTYAHTQKTAQTRNQTIETIWQETQMTKK